MRDEISIKEFLTQSNLQQNEAWYDWFCRKESLPNKTIALVNKLRQIALSPRIDVNNQYVFFKNNCPVNGDLYDDFRICDMTTKDVVYNITPKVGHAKSKKEMITGERKGLSEVWGKDNNFEKALVIGNWKDVLKFFQV